MIMHATNPRKQMFFKIESTTLIKHTKIRLQELHASSHFNTGVHQKGEN
jgi:hypothetical protein